ncbi:hypothetical protein EYR36_002471 [Pleurotus pulmonarius]|nr:hypothetical protein EYR36_002471 [Pleurotus pulmonarius]
MSTTWPAAWNVVQDLRCIPELTTQDFLEFVIPPVPQQNLDNILRSLKSGAVTDGRIKGFDKDPRQAGLTKDEQFRHLHDFSERALAIASGELAATATLASRYTPHETPRSEKRNGSRPDKSLVLKDAPQPNEGRVGWQDIVLAFEFKLDDKDNDLYDDYEPYVQLLVGLAFAHVFDHDTTAVPGLLRAHGYDPTVQRLDNSGNYSIRVGDKTYITCGVLSDFRAESICGRCTRVWKVYEEGDETTFYALKDAWVDRRNQTEGEIWKRLKKDLNNEVFSKHFLTLVTCTPDAQAVMTCDFWGRGSHSAEENVRYFEDHVVRHVGLQQPAPTLSPASSKHVYSDSSRSGIIGMPDDYPAYQLQCQCRGDHPVYIPRRHDRTVWKEICTPYENITDLSTMIVSLQHAIIGSSVIISLSGRLLKPWYILALHAMWKDSKAIHRDLSSGNVYYDDKNGCGRLGDLEFVTFYTDDAVSKGNSHSLSIKIGTLQFMACEVSAGSYLMRPRTPSVTLARRLFSLSDPQTSSPTPLGQRLPVLLNSSDTLDIPDTSDTDLHSTEVYDDADETPTFLHNPIHDLESVWWLLIWTLLRFHPKSTAPLDHNALRDQLGVFLSLFPGTQAQREHALQSINLNHTSTKISLIGTAQISEHVKYLSKVLVDMYTAVEKSFPIPNAAFDGAHSVVLGILKLISGRVGRIPVGTLVPIQATLAELEQGGRAKV